MTAPRLMLCETITAAELAKRNWDGYTVDEKLDGCRILVKLHNGKVTLTRRSGTDATAQYPEVVSALTDTCWPDCELDCELIINQSKKPDAHIGNFNKLQSREHTTNPTKVKLLAKAMPATLVAFDILSLGITDFRNMHYAWRREQLDILFSFSASDLNVEEKILDCSYYQDGYYAKDFFKNVTQLGGEGVILKKNNSVYEPRRSVNWLKVKKQHEADLDILGFTSERRQVSALITEKGKVNYSLPEPTASEWIEPLENREPLIAVVQYHELTKDGLMRFPVLKEVRRKDGKRP